MFVSIYPTCRKMFGVYNRGLNLSNVIHKGRCYSSVASNETLFSLNDGIKFNSRAGVHVPSHYQNKSFTVKKLFGPNFLAPLCEENKIALTEDNLRASPFQRDEILRNRLQEYRQHLITLALEVDEEYRELTSNLFETDSGLLLTYLKLVLSKSHTIICGGGVNMAGYAFVDSSLKKKFLLQMSAIYSQLLFKNVITSYVDCSQNHDIQELVDEALSYKEIKALGLTVDLKLKSLNKQGYFFALFVDNACSANPTFWNALHDISTDDKNCVVLGDASSELFKLFCFNNDAFKSVQHHGKIALNNTKIRHIFPTEPVRSLKI